MNTKKTLNPTKTAKPKSKNIVQRSRLLTQENWLDIKAMYHAGMPLRKIADKYDIAHRTISGRAAREGWHQNYAAELAQIEQNFAQVAEKIPDDTKHIVAKSLKDKLDQAFELSRDVNNHASRSVKLSNRILKNIETQYDSGALNDFETAKILDTSVSTVKKVAEYSGLSKQAQAQTNVQINNSSQQTDSNINLSPQDAYLALIGN